MKNDMKATDCLCRLHELIQQGRTGTPDELACRLRISRAQLYRILNVLNDYGADVRYSRTSNTFAYNNSFKMSFTKVEFSFSE